MRVKGEREVKRIEREESEGDNGMKKRRDERQMG